MIENIFLFMVAWSFMALLTVPVLWLEEALREEWEKEKERLKKRP
jgi:hypothetical protein